METNRSFSGDLSNAAFHLQVWVKVDIGYTAQMQFSQ